MYVNILGNYYNVKFSNCNYHAKTKQSNTHRMSSITQYL